VLVPGKQRRQFYNLYKDVKTDQAGDFILTGIAPGDYELFAWNDVEDGEWEDPDFLGPLESYAARVNDEDCQRKSIALKVIQESGR
jgi:hypothetical protein